MRHHIAVGLVVVQRQGLPVRQAALRLQQRSTVDPFAQQYHGDREDQVDQQRNHRFPPVSGPFDDSDRHEDAGDDRHEAEHHAGGAGDHESHEIGHDQKPSQRLRSG